MSRNLPHGLTHIPYAALVSSLKKTQYVGEHTGTTAKKNDILPNLETKTTPTKYIEQPISRAKNVARANDLESQWFYADMSITCKPPDAIRTLNLASYNQINRGRYWDPQYYVD
ncbi:hypothetical protein TWF694_008536 [Orbilia ellipsospora]|uniref:Uncharacterized protein n=1 Tax=Orbilia ellipsospora TaxID=2528407 RepID=A0AAV9XGF0_9PEZI